jgi:uncharacterized membrane protein YhiD involved in acid resistance
MSQKYFALLMVVTGITALMAALQQSETDSFDNGSVIRVLALVASGAGLITSGAIWLFVAAIVGL